MIKPIQIIAIIFAIFLLLKAILRLKNKKLTINEFLFWSAMWMLLTILSIFPQISDKIANFFGFGRGLDFFIVSSILLIFYLIFRIYIMLEELDSKIVKLARSISLKEIKDIKSLDR
ncbi:MAG: DUF2304 family protein [Actinobacteria bacterium]|nr:DUF2304 family protein [Actinomycetota bacterium]